MQHRKWTVGLCSTGSGLLEYAGQEVDCWSMQDRKWTVGACRTGSGLLEYAAQEVDCWSMQHRKEFELLD